MRFFPLLLLVLLCDCGRKPTGLSTPDAGVAEAYPQAYPKPPVGQTPLIIPDVDLTKKYTARPEQGLQP